MIELESPLRELLRDPVDDDRMRRIRKRLVRSALRPERGRRLLWAAAAAAAACLLVAVAALLVRRSGSAEAPEGPLRLAGGGELAARLEGARVAEADVTLGDGSTIHLDPGTELEVVDNDGARMTLELVVGRVLLDIRPGGPRRWTLRAGLADVEVVGTRFAVERRPGLVEVAVERGEVLVRGDRVEGGRRRLEEGESLVVRAEAAPRGPREEPGSSEGPASGDGAAANGPADGGDGLRPSWRALARTEAYDEAYGLLGPEGVRRETGRARSARDLFALADVARLSGHPRDAVAPLEQIVARYPSEPRAPVAAFTLGRLYLDVLGDPRRAASAFSRAIELGPPAGLREDAYARLVEARSRSGDREGARAAAETYLRRYPEGRHADRVRAMSGIDGP